MRKYDPNDRLFWPLQTIRLTFQQWNKKAVIDVGVGGNCMGLPSLMESALYLAYQSLEKDEHGDRLIILKRGTDHLYCSDEEKAGEEWLGAMLVGAEIIKSERSPRSMRSILADEQPTLGEGE